MLKCLYLFYIPKSVIKHSRMFSIEFNLSQKIYLPNTIRAGQLKISRQTILYGLTYILNNYDKIFKK